MSLISKFLVIAVIGGIMLLVNIFIIKDDKVKLILNLMAAIDTFFWFLQSFGILVGHINAIH